MISNNYSYSEWSIWLTKFIIIDMFRIKLKIKEEKWNI